MVWFGLVLIYDKLVQSGSKFSIKGLVSPFLKRFGLNGFINFKQFGLVFIINKWFGFIINKWFGLVSRLRNRTEPGPLLVMVILYSRYIIYYINPSHFVSHYFLFPKRLTLP